MKVSAIIFSENYDININKCIDCIQNQTLDEIEIIIVLKNKYIDITENIEFYKNNYNNIKIINSINECLSVIEGEYVCFLTPNKYIYENSIERLYEESVKHNLDITCFAYNNSYDYKNKYYCLRNINVINGLDFYIKLVSIGGNLHEDISLNFYKSEFIKKININFNRDINSLENIYRFMISADRVKYLHDNLIYTSTDKNIDIPDVYLDKIKSIKYLINEYNTRIDGDSSELKKALRDNINKNINKIMIDCNKIYLQGIMDNLNDILKSYDYEFNIDTEIGVNLPSLYNNIMLSKNNKDINISKLDEIRLYNNEKKIFYMLLPEHGNLGDQAIVYATLKFLEDKYPEHRIIKFNFLETVEGVDVIKKTFNIGDFIVLHGGGNMGNLYVHEEKARRYVIASLIKYPIVSFPQTIYFSDDCKGNEEFELSKRYYSYNKNLVLLARENRSYNIMNKNFINNNIYFCPDIVFYLNNKVKFNPKHRKQIMTCFRKDKETYYNLNSKTELIDYLGKIYSVFENDTIVNYMVGHLDREKELQNLWNEYSKSKVVITDRLHGMIFAVITKTPCIVLRSLDYKVLETYELIKDLNYIRLVDTLDVDYIREIVKEMEGLEQFDTISDKLDNFNELKDFIDLNLAAYGYDIKSNKRNKIKINVSYNEENKISYNFEIDKEIQRYFNYNNMNVKYSENLGTVPKGILIIPALCNLIPISWFVDFDIYIDELDEAFNESIYRIKCAYEKMYGTKLGGNIIVKQLTNNEYERTEKCVSLFSGGVDSISTVIDNINKDMDLATIWGSDIHTGNKTGWEYVEKSVKNIGEKFSLKNTFIVSDHRECLNYSELDRLLYIKGLSAKCWWTHIQHGISHIALLTPYSYKYKMGKIYVPGTLEESYVEKYGIMPMASDPTIDNEFKFASCSTIHDGFMDTRQDKIANICRFKKNIDFDFDIRVCFSSSNGENCNICKKCSITILGLIQQKQDPNKFGFKVDKSLLMDMRDRYENEFVFEHFALNWWEKIKNKFLEDREFWLQYPYISWIMFIDTSWEFNLSKAKNKKSK